MICIISSQSVLKVFLKTSLRSGVLYSPLPSLFTANVLTTNTAYVRIKSLQNDSLYLHLLLPEVGLTELNVGIMTGEVLKILYTKLIFQEMLNVVPRQWLQTRMYSR